MFICNTILGCIVDEWRGQNEVLMGKGGLWFLFPRLPLLLHNSKLVVHEFA